MLEFGLDQSENQEYFLFSHLDWTEKEPNVIDCHEYTFSDIPF